MEWEEVEVMPYIPASRRIEIRDGSTPQNPGELNFKITSIILEYLYELNPSEPNCYAEYNEVLGVLECCKLEIYRKLIAKYEDRKCLENGEIFK